jgi:hypothetical protein
MSRHSLQVLFLHARRQHGIIVFRPKTLHEHDAQFIISCNLADPAGSSNTAMPAQHVQFGAATSAVCSCWEVPLHLQQQHWTAVLTQHAAELSQRQLVLSYMAISQVLKVLSKFEASCFVYTYMPGCCPPNLLQQRQALHSPAASSLAASGPPVLAATGAAAPGMLWHLPRCGLQFELQADGRVASLDHRGYSPSQQQLLVSCDDQPHSYTLPEFHQYLVLEVQQDSSSGAYGADSSSQLVLVPSGRVQVKHTPPGSLQSGASKQVELSTACSDQVKVSSPLQACMDGLLAGSDSTVSITGHLCCECYTC